MLFHDLVKYSHTLLVVPLVLYVGCKGLKGELAARGFYLMLMAMGFLALVHHSGLFNFHKLTEGFYFEEKIRSKKANNWFTGPKTYEVEIVDYEFRPQFINVLRGDTVKWINRDTKPHCVTSYTDLFCSGELKMNEEFSYTCNEAGVLNYFCKNHPYMKGSVSVVNATDRHQGHEEDMEWNPYVHPQNQRHLQGKIIG
jgi:plastocyanin